MSRAGFRKLSDHVAAEYRGKGYSAKRARKIGNATAGKIARQKKAKRRHG